ncbi:thioredoxin [Luteithermobacter gelatinilyticus]|mgnify:CR=1 FL=1|uniref:thioredoxin n=1 Tax=Luteithermobacter gelatinilyticus TaxID=2582913 RepID=UPI0011071175|nr:thioredoxin [Luteithermobacter gelatinilyticus]
MQDMNFAGATPSDTGDLIKDSTISGFMKDVIETSQQVPVLVDFWAPWCEPCKALTPTLEQVVKEAKGAVRLVKINIDENQQLAAQMQIRSVPTVVMFSGGRPVDAFAGALNADQIRQFIARFVGEVGPSPEEQLLEQAAMLKEQGDLENAGALYSQLLQSDPEHAGAIAGLAKVLIQMGDLENARNVLSSAPAEQENNAEILSARRELEMAEQAAELGDVTELEAKLFENPENHQARFDLALALWAQQRREEAGEQLLEIIRRDRSWNEDGARQQLVKFFEIAGPADPFTVKMRQKLSSLLFA